LKTLLLISGGIEAIPGIKIAKELGLFVVVSDGNPNAPGFEYADDKIVASTYDVKETVKKVKHYHTNIRKLNGVICIASDVPLTVASVADELNLPGIPVESSRLAMDKLAMKDTFVQDGVAVPDYTEIFNVEYLKNVIKKWGYPIVIKPVDSRGARGVLRLNHSVDPNWAWNHSAANSPTGRVIAEKFLIGPQVSTESMLIDGQCYTPGFSDRNYEYIDKYAPYIIENGGDLPSSLPMEVQSKVKDMVKNAALSMGIENGIVKGDVVIHNGRPYIIELAARLSGGYFCSHEIPLNSGVDFVGSAIKMAIGEKVNPIDLRPIYNRHVCQRYKMKTSGTIKNIFSENAKKSKSVEYLVTSMSVGDRMTKPTNSNGWVAMVITSGMNSREALNNAQTALDKIIIEKY